MCIYIYIYIYIIVYLFIFIYLFPPLLASSRASRLSGGGGHKAGPARRGARPTGLHLARVRPTRTLAYICIYTYIYIYI